MTKYKEQMTNRILSQCYKELAQFKRDRLTVALAFLLPFMTLVIFGFAIRLEAKNIPLYVQDFDNSPLSRSYVERLFATNQFIPVSEREYSQLSVRDPQSVVDRGLAKVAVVIPPDFSRKIKSETPVEVQAIVDGSDVNNARVIRNSIQATTLYFLRSSKLQPNTNKVVARTRLWFNPGRKESLYIVPGLFGLILWIYPSLLAAIAMVRERTQGTIVQVYASDLSATELLLGKGLAYAIVGILEAIFILGSGMLIWRIGLVGEPILSIASTLIYLADSVMFGLLIGCRAANQTTAIQAVALIGFLTALLLSGFIYPLSNIPFPLSLIANVVPARYYVEISRDAFVRGTGWSGVWLFFIVLIVLGLFIFNAARMTLKRMQLPD
jgi:ABC-2 type transport system permease protein